MDGLLLIIIGSLTITGSLMLGQSLIDKSQISKLKTIRGVNLGGWMVLEKWITPSLFDGLNADDEFSFCEELKENKDETIAAHRLSFVTYDDFKWIREHGFNTVRIPVPYWVFGDVEPYVGCKNTLDFAFEAALEHDLMVIIDLHTARGSQNGQDHSGTKGRIDWHKDPANIDSTLEIIEKLTAAYAQSSNFVGIELLNEPSARIPHEILLDFYKRGYKSVRKYTDAAVIFSDAYLPLDWAGDFDKSFNNILLDIHLYQAFGNVDQNLSMDQHIQKALKDWRRIINDTQGDIPVLVGEWSLGLDNHAFIGHDSHMTELAYKAYAAAQISTFSTAAGWCFWTYKTENMAGWSARDAIERGWIKLDD